MKPPKNLTRQEMWERIQDLLKTVKAGSVAPLVLPHIETAELHRLAGRQLTTDIWRWVLARQKKKAPEQLTMFKLENGKGIYNSLESVPEALLRKRSAKLRRMAETFIRIADALDEFLARKKGGLEA